MAALGSCNWLSTGFTSFEASVRTNDPLLVSDIMDALAQLAMTVTGLNGGVAAQLAGQAVNIRKSNAPRLSSTFMRRSSLRNPSAARPDRELLRTSDTTTTSASFP